ncbi:MAG: ABC transporter ATP-binding protein, partial [Alphaproteobacteria bacterium]|nr:ABC transporter ATP-binding protein [Alphaproteobacteria bacterium]
AVCTRAMIIADGRIVADGTPEELESRSPYHNAVLIDARADGVSADLQNLDGVDRVEELGDGRYRIYPAVGRSILAEVSDLARQKAWNVSRLTVETPRLDEVFRRITQAGGDGREAA